MVENPNEKDGHDLGRISGLEDFEARHFAEQNGIGVDKARELISRHGGDRGRLRREAQKLKRP